MTSSLLFALFANLVLLQAQDAKITKGSILLNYNHSVHKFTLPSSIKKDLLQNDPNDKDFNIGYSVQPIGLDGKCFYFYIHTLQKWPTETNDVGNYYTYTTYRYDSCLKSSRLPEGDKEVFEFRGNALIGADHIKITILQLPHTPVETKGKLSISIKRLN